MDAAPAKKPMSRTAEAAAFGRAIESLRQAADRLVFDPFARLFLNRHQKLLLTGMRVPSVAGLLLALHERSLPGVFGNLLCRTRFIDEQLSAAIDGGTEQLVLLGSGFDTRAYRMAALRKLPVFELDRPEVLSKKRALLESTLGEFPGNVSLIGLDFREQGWERGLAANGFDPARTTFFICEGVTQYVSVSVIDDVLHFVANAAPASQVAFTYVDQSVIDGSTTRSGDLLAKDWAQRLGEPWMTGFAPDQIGDFLAARQLEIVSHVGASEYDQRYLKPSRRSLGLYGGERVVLARVMA